MLNKHMPNIIQTPNLSLESCGGRSVLRNETQTEWYKSIKQCAELRHIPIKVLRLAQSKGCPGITPENRVYWSELQPWLSDRYDSLYVQACPAEEEDAGNREKLELRKLKAEVVKLENYNRSKSKDYVSRKLVLQTMRTIYSNLFSQLNRYLEHEQPAKVSGMTEVQVKKLNKEYLTRLLSTLKTTDVIIASAEDVSEEPVAAVEPVKEGALA